MKCINTRLKISFN